MDAWGDFENKLIAAEPVGPRLSCWMRTSGTSRGSGVEVEREVSMLFGLRDARLVRFHIYPTHERALAVARQTETPG
jgi:hypothetical protein